MPIRPKGYENRALRRRHNLTQQQLADSLYGVKRVTVADWEIDRRKCGPMSWWAIVLIWDKIDLWSDEDKWRRKYRVKKMEGN